ncbi:hypothetical protein [Streptomyces sp. NPDC029674]|uniref:DUF7144 family membrane protein n=1 Tax=Streptomyces sp. NPDC029674 TaxID=3365297 RepID=UPI00384B3BD8
MSSTAAPGDHRPGGNAPHEPHHKHAVAESPWAAGGTMFAGVLMMVNGILGIFEGIAGIAKDDVYERIGDYVYKFNLTTWGWIHLILGILVAVVGWGILKGASWAKASGVALAALAIVAQFLWLPYTPIWALISIAIGVFVIWALCNDRSDVAGP